jgi:hypothetical protein
VEGGGTPPGSDGSGAPRPRGSRGVAALLAASAVAAAVLGAVASFAASDANESWTNSQIREGQRSSVTVNFAFGLYAGDGAAAVEVAQSRLLAARLRAAAATERGAVRVSLLAEVRAQRDTARALAFTLPGMGRRFRLGAGYDMGALLLRSQRVSLYRFADSPELEAREGDRQAARGVSAVLVTIPVSVAFLLATLGQAFERRRRVFLLLGWAVLGAAVLAGALVVVTG